MKYNNSNLCLIIAFFVFGVTASQNKTDVITKANAQYYLEKAIKTENLDSILAYSNKVLAYSKQDSLSAYAFYNLAYVSFRKNKFEESNTYLDTCISIFKKENIKSYVYKSYSLKGTIAELNQSYNNAISYYENALQFASSEKELYAIKYNLSIIYTKTKEYTIAKDYLQDILEFKNKNPGVIDGLVICYTYMGLTYVAPTFVEKLEASNKAILEAKKINNQGVIAETIANRGVIYLDEKMHYKSLQDFLQSNKIAKQLNSTNLVIRNYLTIAELYNKTEAFRLSNAYLDSIAINSVTYEDGKSIKTKLDSLYYSNYFNLKEYKKSISYLKKYTDLLAISNDSIINAKYAEYGKKYQTERKIQENTLLKKENTIKQLEVEQQKMTRNYLLLFSLLGVILLSVTYSRFRSKKKAAYLLAKQNTIISQQKIELEKSNANKQKLFAIIAHDLVNPFNAILGYTNLLDEEYNNFTDTERKTFISTINKYANNNYNLTRTLLDWAKVQQDKLVVNKVTLNCKDIVVNAIQPYQILADKKNINIITNIPEDIIIEADQNMMQTVLGNLFVNAIKFTPDCGTIIINLKKLNDGTINLEIEDTGIGMTQEQVNNIFDITKVTSLKGTNQEKGHGLGLILCKELMELQKGTLQIFSQLNKGSKAVVTI